MIDAHGPNSLAMVINPGLCLEDISRVIGFACDRLGLSTIYFLPDIPQTCADDQWADASELLHAGLYATDVVVANLAGDPLADCLVLQSRVDRLIRAGARYVACDPATRGHDCLNIEPETFLDGLIDRVMGSKSDSPINDVLDELIDRPRWFVIVPQRILCGSGTRILERIRTLRGVSKEKFRFIVHCPHANGPALSAIVRNRHGSIRLAGGAELAAELTAGRLAGLYLVDVDPVRQLSGGQALARAFTNLEFIAAHDVFATQSTRRADVILPMTCYLETAGTILSGAGTELHVPRVLDGPKGARRVGDVVWQIDRHMNKAGRSHGSMLRHVEQSVPGSTGKSLVGRVKLIIRDTPWHKGTGKRTVKTGLTQLQNHDAIVLSSEQAVVYGIRGGTSVLLRSEHAEIAVRAVVSERVRPGWAVISNYFEQTCAQLLWGAGDCLADPISVMIMPMRGINNSPYALTADQTRYLHFRRSGRGTQ